MSGLIQLDAGLDPALSGGELQVREPATGRPIAVVSLAAAADVDPAVAAAAQAQPGWAATPPTGRAAVMRRAAAVLERHRQEIVDLLVREGGSVRGKADFEVGAVLDELWSAAALPTRPNGHLLASEPGRESFARRVPLGVVGVISPWNVPLVLAMRAVAPALALGNAVVVKPDVHTPVSGGRVITRLFEEAGLPAGLLQVLPGDAEVGEALVRHPDVPMIAFTGSSEVGARIGAVAGGMLKRVSLELGGNNALIVLDDADLDAAASSGAWGSFFHQGQICMAAGRHLVHRAVADRYLELLADRARKLRLGDPFREEVDLGPVIGERQLDRVERIVRESVAAGAVVLAGGARRGPFFEPTVLAGVTPDMPAFTEEVFGPVAPVTVVADDDEAVELANRTAYGLTAAVQTGSVRRGRAIADRLRTGMVHVNDQTINDEAHVPHGGRGASGNGTRHGSEHSWDEYTQWQWLTVRETPARYPF
ncbi:aldehyde dehydrogenase family protein [Kitasatospora xanthocidica]|uniref:Aldehyde dehydrogenase family protein n=1 Tax=Kitasatospora xanthocidica TaxID=83382 RepID=A0A373A245_9ACTN|nr:MULTISPECIES: benzaldehyde dehydrogenase [Streptomycetaceae]OKI03061.1 benzaldehyde dehydrogenase [Streptomyces sp. CB02056]RGD62139.1 aldehyde dehydrogenase family protein [Kitasatospora xanthocidica]